jgi:hypothetical protein
MGAFRVNGRDRASPISGIDTRISKVRPIQADEKRGIRSSEKDVTAAG